MRHAALALAMAIGAASPTPASAAAATAGQLDWSTSGWSPAAEWRTLEVPGYRLHFPAAAEPWARHLAARLPGIRARVATAVGWDAREVVDVVLADPVAQPNGAAWPLLGRPRLVLLLTPPSASSALAEFVDWPELLIAHEQAHLSHLLRPSRQPLLRLLRLPVGPIALRAPRWVVEGYATLVEGRLTGSGRPSGALRAAVLRRWAQRGRLPGYGALAGDSRHYLGESMAYLAGSAFLEWLERRAGEGSLGRLWRRLTARQGRSFDDAFRGVFAEPPANLWGRFTAELTWQAIEVERRLGSGGRDGEPWLDRDWGTGRPALSRDGSQLVVALSSRRRPPRLAVYPTADDAAAARRQEREPSLVERDPEDVPAVRSGAPPRRPAAVLELAGTTVDPAPRFLPDGSVLFARSLPDADGSYRSDLFRWWPDGGRVDRLTRGADLRAADPAADGEWAVAVESRWGQTRLVRVELASAEVTPVTTASVAVVVDAPRVSPDGERVAFLRHRGSGWELVVRTLAGGAEQVVATPAGAAVQDPAWAPAGDALFAVVGADGLLDVHLLSVVAADGLSPRRLTRSLGAALAPEPTPDGGALFFLALEPEGMQVRRMELRPATGEEAQSAERSAGGDATDRRASAGDAKSPDPEALHPKSLDPKAQALEPKAPAVHDVAELYPALPPPASPPPPPVALTAVPASRDYGLGRAAWSLLAGGSATTGGTSVELGVRGGDLVGRWDVLALAAAGTEEGARGGALAGSWRGWPVELSVHGYAVRERPTASHRHVSPAAAAFDLDGEGLELAARWHRSLLGGGVAARLAAGGQRLEAAGAATSTRHSTLLEASLGKELRRGRWRAGADASIAGQRGTTAGEGWNRRGGRLDLDLARGGTALALGIERQALGGDPTAVDLLRVGGLAGSLLPALATGHHILAPGLPAAALVGRRYARERLALTLPSLPLRPFWERHRVAALAGWGDWLALAGLDLELRLPPLPLLDLPGARLQLGAAYGLDAPYRGDVNAWAGISWRP